MWNEPEDQIQRELGPEERLLWAGRPRRGLVFRPIDLFLIPFSLIWCGFAVFWEAAVILGGAPFFFALFGVPFVLMGLFFVFGRFWADGRQRANTCYGVTNERVIIVSGLWQRSTKSVNLAALTDVSLSEKSDGSGTITFGSPIPAAWMAGANWSGMHHLAVPTVELIDNARSVYNLIRNAQRDAKNA